MTRRLLAELCSGLAAASLGARRLTLAFYRVDNSTAAVAIGTSRPCRDARQLERLFAEKLEQVDLGFGIERAILEAAVVEPLLPEPLAWRAMGAGDLDQARDLAPLVDRLSNRLGPDAVSQLAPRASHIPERAQERVPALSPGAAAPFAARGLHGPAPSRPLRLLARPEPIEAVAPLPDEPPVLFRWRRALHKVATVRGPERLAPEWWREPDADPAARDPRLLRGRGHRGRPLLAVPRGPLPRRRGHAAVVPARPVRLNARHEPPRPMTAYAELQITSNFSFLRGGSHPEELVLRAAELGLSAIALTDRNTLAGVVRAHIAAKEVGIRFVVGARLDLMPRRTTLAEPASVRLGSRRRFRSRCRSESIARSGPDRSADGLAPASNSIDGLASSVRQRRYSPPAEPGDDEKPSRRRYRLRMRATSVASARTHAAPARSQLLRKSTRARQWWTMPPSSGSRRM